MGKKTPDAPQPSGRIEGEGSYTAARAYNRGTRAFTNSGQVGPAARKAAASRDSSERPSLDAAERAGKSRSKGEDPAVARRGSKAERS